MRTQLNIDGRITVPADLRNRDLLLPGDTFQVERIAKGQYRLSRIGSERNRGLVDWLLSCPEKGYFVPIDSASTDATGLQSSNP
jgi:bifunctional DNA-binding transcriptional regulator/antitoxin component of YhaV-PrlF toxin-antitoxin module